MALCFAHRIGILKTLKPANCWWRYKTHSLGNYWKNKLLKLYWKAFLLRHQNVKKKKKKIDYFTNQPEQNLETCWTAKKKKKEAEENTICMTPLYKIQKHIKIMYGVRSHAGSSVQGEGLNNRGYERDSRIVEAWLGEFWALLY